LRMAAAKLMWSDSTARSAARGDVSSERCIV
jgi:hypothetical protein